MSFDIALSGIQAINDSLNTTSHNIANAGTYGFKSSRANFSSMVAGNQQPRAWKVGSITQSMPQWRHPQHRPHAGRGHQRPRLLRQPRCARTPSTAASASSRLATAAT
jgi:flagellar basal body rod protein FlgB